MDDIKVFAQNAKELVTLIQTIRIYNRDIGTEFSTEKCAMLIMKSRKRKSAEEIEIRNKECIRTLRKTKNCYYFAIKESDIIKKAEMKETIRKEYKKRTRKLLEIKLCCRNLTQGINTWTVPLVSFSGLFLKWTKKEVRQTKDKKIHDYARGFTSERWQIIWVKKRKKIH